VTLDWVSASANKDFQTISLLLANAILYACDVWLVAKYTELFQWFRSAEIVVRIIFNIGWRE
jgi:hypothetical protein